ncbi:hypothetical protein A8C32_03845 [Flavivirga aquatica]|uniref:Glycosyltransferase 2-like domain-containing protein n=1 Tax=Flavivirga aquatica TaxID=1849968 RepID=A0A1E5TB32_9FLAO|nr:glycosyltransferase [Flavivirga aquatica]OEK08592.1 hypothetical protein A8C32_03845 [Flavivirga aquatica]
MRLSIIVPVFNVEKYISGCIDSLINQNLGTHNYEILIINDGSKDNSISIANSYAKKYKNVLVYSQENQGVGAARNKGVKLAKGDYIYFIDPDDYLASNVLKTILDCADWHKVDIVTFMSCKTTFFNINNSNTDNTSSLKAKISKNGIEYIADRGFKNEVWWYIINREFLVTSGVCFIHGRWMEDAIFTVSLLIEAGKVAYLPLDAHRHVKVEGSAMTSKEPEHYLKVIYDNENAAVEYAKLIERIKEDTPQSKKCITRLKARQQSFVFFMMIRIMKSVIKLKNVKLILKNLTKIGAYPLNSFIGNDYNGIVYRLITKVLNIKRAYFILFIICNPFLRFKK